MVNAVHLCSYSSSLSFDSSRATLEEVALGLIPSFAILSSRSVLKKGDVNIFWVDVNISYDGASNEYA